jgi:Fe-S oxidoreductase
VPGLESPPNILMPQEWLLDATRGMPAAVRPLVGFRLLPHCTERPNAGAATHLWKEVFATAGLSLTMPASGCCGMFGTYGHELRNFHTSKTIFEQSLSQQIDSHPQSQAEKGTELLATGYSCRSQVSATRNASATSRRSPFRGVPSMRFAHGF